MPYTPTPSIPSGLFSFLTSHSPDLLLHLLSLSFLQSTSSDEQHPSSPEQRASISPVPVSPGPTLEPLAEETDGVRVTPSSLRK